MKIIKRILAVFVGIMVGSLVVWAIEMVGHYMYPPPADLDFTDKAALEQFIATAPLGSKLFIVLAYALGSFTGGLITQLITQSKNAVPALITGMFLLIAGIINMISIPHPLWLMIACLIVFIPGAYAGGALVRKKTQPQ